MPLLRTILRRGFFAAATFSTLLLLAALILWPVSYYRHVAAFYFTARGWQYWIDADSGRARGVYASGVIVSPGWHLREEDPNWSHWSYLTWNMPEPEVDTFARESLGVCWYFLHPGAVWTDDAVLIPFSYLALLFSILPLLAFRSIRRRRKANHVGLCPKCGYDLRAQKAGDHCPECGTLIPPPKEGKTEKIAHQA